jgi:hypothetical protein
MSSLKTPEVAIHALFQELGCDLDEIKHCIKEFLNGDSGDFSDEDEILGFLARDLKDEHRHGVYETSSAGRIHITGDSNQIIVAPDIIFAVMTEGAQCSLNTCTCENKHSPKDKSSTPTK